MHNLKHPLIHFAGGWSVLSKSEATSYSTPMLGKAAHEERVSKKGPREISFLAGALSVTYVVSRFKCHTAFFTDIAHWNHVMKLILLGPESHPRDCIEFI